VQQGPAGPGKQHGPALHGGHGRRGAGRDVRGPGRRAQGAGAAQVGGGGTGGSHGWTADAISDCLI